MALYMGKTVKDGLQRMWKGMDVGSFQVYSGGSRKTHENPSPV
jgi:hypothetical protein